MLKADIKKYFENVNHNILLTILKKRISDKNVLLLIDSILSNYQTKERDIGMPLGNLTSQFFANVYLNELDQFVKHELKVKYYIRYVDDFVILSNNSILLQGYVQRINEFLQTKLAITLHPEKSRITRFGESFTFLGMRVFFYYRLLKKSNIRKMKKKFYFLKEQFEKKDLHYDIVYDFLEGWGEYARNANTYTLRKELGKEIYAYFFAEISTKEINRHLKQQRRSLHITM